MNERDFLTYLNMSPILFCCCSALCCFVYTEIWWTFVSHFVRVLFAEIYQIFFTTISGSFFSLIYTQVLLDFLFLIFLGFFLIKRFAGLSSIYIQYVFYGYIRLVDVFSFITRFCLSIFFKFSTCFFLDTEISCSRKFLHIFKVGAFFHIL